MIRAGLICQAIWLRTVDDIGMWTSTLRIGGSMILFENANGNGRRVGIRNIIRIHTRIRTPILIGRVGLRGVSIIEVCLVARVVGRLVIEDVLSWFEVFEGFCVVWRVLHLPGRSLVLGSSCVY